MASNVEDLSLEFGFLICGNPYDPEIVVEKLFDDLVNGAEVVCLRDGAMMIGQRADVDDPSVAGPRQQQARSTP
jgi:hypothetical protein